MDVEHCSGAQLVEFEDDGVVLGPQEQVQVADNMDASTKITLYALVGNPSTQTMKVKGRIKNHEVVYFIDSGSTHNFLAVAELYTLNLPLDTHLIYLLERLMVVRGCALIINHSTRPPLMINF